jgi:hypothetical protein
MAARPATQTLPELQMALICVNLKTLTTDDAQEEHFWPVMVMIVLLKMHERAQYRQQHSCEL